LKRFSDSIHHLVEASFAWQLDLSFETPLRAVTASLAYIDSIGKENDMLGDYSAALITIGILSCVLALGWFFDSALDAAGSYEDTLPPKDDTVQQQRASIYMAAVMFTMAATIVSVIV
jgi:hypothetical protein